MRWRAGYGQGDGVPLHAMIEAATRDEAVERLRDVIGAETAVLFVVPDGSSDGVAQGETYEQFLHDPGSDGRQGR